VDEESNPFVEYVRFTYPNQVVHVAWGRTDADTATLSIPARSDSAALIDINGTTWTVEPVGGVYQIVVEGATCNDPVYNCLVGGDPWFLVEEVPDAVDTEVLPVSAAEGGTLPTPAPATEIPAPTDPPEDPEEQEIEPTTEPDATATPEAVAELPPTEGAPAVESTPDVVSIDALEQELQPTGLDAAAPYILIGLGAVVIVGGGVYFALGTHQANENREHSSPAFEDNVAPTQETTRPDLDDEEAEQEPAADEMDSYYEDDEFTDEEEESVDDEPES
ncbi:MAG: hypothetical protein ACFB51_05710, partial [Anaerolineae bacterium]